MKEKAEEKDDEALVLYFVLSFSFVAAAILGFSFLSFECFVFSSLLLLILWCGERTKQQEKETHMAISNCSIHFFFSSRVLKNSS